MFLGVLLMFFISIHAESCQQNMCFALFLVTASFEAEVRLSLSRHSFVITPCEDAGILEKIPRFCDNCKPVPIPIINGHRLKRMFGVSRWDRGYSSASPPEPPNIATFWPVSTFDVLLNAAMICTKYVSVFCLGLPHKNR